MRRYLALVTALMILSAPAVAQDNFAPSTPTEFYGSVTYDNGDQIQGDVLAIVGSEIKSQVSIEEGSYEMIVEKDDGESFSEVEFVVDTGQEQISTGTNGEFNAFESQEVNLQISEPQDSETDDSSGSSSSGGFSGTVSTNEEPVAGFTWDTPVRPGEEVTMNASGSFDPDGNISEYSWSFGATGETATNVFGSTGTYTVNLTVVDDSGTETEVSKDVTVVENKDPIPRFDHIYTTPDSSENVRFNASESYDPDGEIVDYRWSFGATGEEVNGSFDGEEAEVTLTVVDNEGATANVTGTLSFSSTEEGTTEDDTTTEEEGDEDNVLTGAFTGSVSDVVTGLLSSIGDIVSSIIPF